MIVTRGLGLGRVQAAVKTFFIQVYYVQPILGPCWALTQVYHVQLILDLCWPLTRLDVIGSKYR